jgi:hypothetical protein
MPLDPEIAAQLDAIDATLAGEPVDPQYAELAELALLLRDERPAVDPDFASSMDRRVAQRFAGAPASDSAATPRFSLPWREWMRPVAGIAAGLAVVAAVVVAVGPGGGGSSASSSSAASAPATTSASSAAPPQRRALSGSSGSATPGSAASGSAASGSAGSGSGSGSAGSSSAPSSAGALAFPSPPNATPTPNGRKIVQSAQLALGAPANRIETVAQEVFDVAGREHAVVNNSNVTAGGGGSAQFQLSVPSSALAATMSALSQLHYANVVSRTDGTQDVNGQYLSDVRKLNDARALRTSLLKQLAKATTQEQIDSLNARIRDAEASIRSDESTLNGLNHKVDFSQVEVNIDSAAAPVPSHGSGHSGFTLGRAAHDAGRVLTVGAGVALITLAVLVPLALIAALAWWIWSAVRRRRREQALDLA